LSEGAPAKAAPSKAPAKKVDKKTS
jgi:hypothetical protein